ESRFHRLDFGEERLHLGEIFVAEYTGIRSGLVSVVLEQIPPAENQIVQIRQRDKLLNFRRIVVGTLSETDGAKLSQRTDGLGQAFANQFDTRQECGADSAHSR